MCYTDISKIAPKNWEMLYTIYIYTVHIDIHIDMYLQLSEPADNKTRIIKESLPMALIYPIGSLNLTQCKSIKHHLLHSQAGAKFKTQQTNSTQYVEPRQNTATNTVGKIRGYCFHEDYIIYNINK